MALLSGLMGRSSAPADEQALIKDGSTQTFMEDVVQASRTQPVIVDFWAPWCGPCKQLGPLLERAVQNAAGKVRLVKINVDENPELAQQLRVQSIPTVYGFVQGQPADGFAGALPESQIKAFIERLVGPVGPGPLENALEQAKAAAAAGQLERALPLFERVLDAEPENPEGLAGLVRCQIGLGRLAQAREILARVPTVHAHHVEVDGARAALALAEESGTLADAARLNARLQADDNDHAARIELATVLFLRGQVEAAIEHLLAAVRRDREGQGEAARKQLVRFFEALGPKHPATVAGRRQLSSILFS